MKPLTNVELRVLGCLLEKEMATPDNYPLSLNSLINACNQKSNRQPVVTYNDDEVLTALESLSSQQFVLQSTTGRVLKYEQRFSYQEGLSNQEAGLLCLLFVRGPQTAGELRSRSTRLAEFASLEEVKTVLEQLVKMEMISLLAKEPGRKEARYNHLWADDKVAEDENEIPPPNNITPQKMELITLQTELTELKEELANLRDEFNDFKHQFD